ncbi:MAG: caspase family protein [Saprospiraceae bacterium]|nr:caspase family protein [Saprospiraceae bacterium]
MKGSSQFSRFLQVFILWVSLTAVASAQCVSGNCYEGSGTYRYSNGNVYSGQFAYGKQNGSGVMRYADKSEYTGEWKNGMRQGKGKMRSANGNVYEGQFVNGNFEGQGTMVYANGERYVGQWSRGMPTKGTYTFTTKERYEGQFVNGNFEGQGTMYYPDGAYYTGGWKNNRKHGEGKLVRPNGVAEAGVWNNGALAKPAPDKATAGSGGVKPTGPSGTSTAGANKPNTTGLRNCNNVNCGNGRGYYTYPDGSMWVGQFAEGRPMGQGICYYSNGDRYEGNWNLNAPNGEGVMHFAGGRVYGAVWVNGAPVQELDSRENVPTGTVKTEKTDNVRIFAVVVGVGKYKTMPALQFTDDDAYRFYTFLKSPEGGALNDSQITLLLDDKATRDNILRSMQQLFLRADDNDVVLFYFSGHGLNGSFLPVDFDGYNNKLRHDEVRQLFLKSKAKHKLCIADACHSGSLSYGLVAKGPAPVTLDSYYQAFEESEGGIALLMSSKAEELSLEDHGLRQGVFTYYLMEGLKGKADSNNDRLVNIQEIYQYVFKQVRTYTSGVQTPVLTGEFDNAMPVSWRRY